MLFLTLLSLISAKPTASQGSGSVTGGDRPYVCLDGVRSVGSQPHALVRYNVQPGGTFYLMKNTDASNGKTWVPVSQYPTDKPMASHDFTELVFPENSDKNAHYCVMYKNGSQEIYSRPYTFNNQSAQWAPSRSVEQDDAIAACATGNKATTYTTKQLDKKEKTKGSTKKRSKTNSASGVCFGMFAGMAVICAVLM